MKPLHLSLLFLALLFTACSLNVTTSDPDGLWEKMKLSKKEVHFDHAGGTDTVSVLNYSTWWFSSACDGECADDNYILPDGPETENVGFNHITGSWWSAEVLKDSPNKIVITSGGALTCPVDDCDKEVYPKKAIINVTAGDIFSSITIYQH